jgi:F-type H+-transporting ATPase subunit alpha
MEVLKQPQYSPLDVEDQVLILFAVKEKYLSDVPVSEVKRFETEMLEFMSNHYPQIREEIVTEKKLSDDLTNQIHEAIKAFKESFMKTVVSTEIVEEEK